MDLNPFNAGREKHGCRWKADAIVPRSEWDKYQKEFLNDGLKGWKLRYAYTYKDCVALDFIDDRFGAGLWLPETKKNLVVNSGVNRSLDRLFGLSGPPTALITIGVDDGASNPVAGTTSSSAGSTNRRLVAFATNSRSSQVVSNSGAFTKANSNFVHKRLFLSAAAAGTSDVANDLAAMTNVFTIDLTGFSDFTQTYSTTYTGAGS